MTSNDDARPTLFLATASADGVDGPDMAFDGSEEAMRRLRHPFAVNPNRPAERPAVANTASAAPASRDHGAGHAEHDA
ncbi:hypothetical protein JNW88_02845 [Micromonospora sp. ATA32]|nr:hypothetical protein [Micromonospora sp. ATA32]